MAGKLPLGDTICNLYQTQGWDVYREFYYNDAGVQIGTLTNSTQLRGKGFKPGDAEWPEASYNGDYIADIATDFIAKKTVSADDRSTTASGDLDDLASIREFAVAYLRREQDLDLLAFSVKFDNYYLESSLYSDGLVDKAVQMLQAAGKTYELDGALWLKSTDYGDDKDRVMRKSAPAGGRERSATIHLFRPRRGLPHHQMAARFYQSRQHSRHRPPRHHRPRARWPASSQCGHSTRLPRLRAAHHGAGDARG